MFIEVQEIYTIIQWLYTYSMIDNEKLHSNNKVSIYIIIAMRAKMANDKAEAFSLCIY